MTDLRAHLREALLLATPAPRKKPLVAYVGAASGDDAGFQKMIGDVIVQAGGRVKGVKLASPRAKLSAATGLLEDCDLVFVSGGDVEAGMTVLHERGVLPLFQALAREGRPMIGISAGSIMLGRAWVRFPDHDDGKTNRKPRVPPSLFPCMGLAPVYVDAHAEEDRWAELRTLLKLVVAAGEAAPVGFGLTRKGGITVEHVKAGAKVVPFGTPAPRFVVKNGRVVAGPRLALRASEVVPSRHSASARASATRRRATQR
jgi:peptidase E